MAQPAMPATNDEERRSQIEASWYRSSMCGLSTTAVQVTAGPESHAAGRLARVSEPVLQRITSHVAGERVAFMMVDRSATLVRTIAGTPAMKPLLERIGAVPGTTWTEEFTGTNALATPFETHRPILIRGEEHYVEQMKDFTCYGAPIINPVSQRLEGVVDLVLPRTSETSLMITVVHHAVAEIEAALREEAGRVPPLLLEEFERASGVSGGAATIALGPSTLLQNGPSMDLLTTADIRRVRTAVEGMTTEYGVRELDIELDNGTRVLAQVEPVDVGHTAACAVVVLRPVGRPIPRRLFSIGTQGERVRREDAPTGEAHQQVVPAWTSPAGPSPTAAIRSTVVLGEPGTGRTTAARALAGSRPFAVLDPLVETAEAIENGLLPSALAATPGVLVVEHLELLSPLAQARLSHLLGSNATLVVATARDPRESTDADGLGALVGRFAERLPLQPLRATRHRVHEWVRAVRPCENIEFDEPSAKAMADYTWPGNLAELQTVLIELIHSGKPVVGLQDLPEHIRQAGSLRLTPWQRASRNAIVAALAQTSNNKSAAADLLGISRNSLYHHIRELGIKA